VNAELTLDDQGRILMAVSLKHRGVLGEPTGLAVVRLSADGRLDRSFGHEGMIRIPYPDEAHVWVYSEGFDVRGDQAAIGASYCPRHGGCQPSVTMVDLGD
jgi:hypothetical protein